MTVIFNFCYYTCRAFSWLLVNLKHTSHFLIARILGSLRGIKEEGTHFYFIKSCLSDNVAVV